MIRKLIHHYAQLLIASTILLQTILGACGYVSALTYQTIEDVEFTFNPTVSITLSDSNLTIDNLTPSSSSDSNIVTVDVATNAGYGYYLSATAGTSTGNTNLTNTSNSSSIFTNLASNAASLNAFPDNYWGYSYSTDNGTTWISGSQGSTSTGYNGLPLDNDDSGATGVVLTSTNSFYNSSSIKFKIGAKAAATQATGIYTNTVNFYAVANPEPSLAPVACTAGKICYNVNSLSATEGTMGQQSAADGNTVTLLASNFSRTGYGFAGWNTSYDYSGTFYGPQEDITVPTGTTANGYSLYAVWVKSAGTMQSDAKRVCNSLVAAPTDGTANLSSVSALSDARDNQTYAIAKLADGNCWMIENLRLESTNSDNSTGTLAQGYGTSATYGNFSGLADAESTGFSSTYSANSLYSNDGSNDTINIGTSNYPAYRMPRYNNTNTSARASSPTANTGAMYSYGNYYTWHAAIANLTHNRTNNISVSNTSLCPSGWHLPQGGRKANISVSDFWILSRAAIGADPANFADDYFYYTGTPEGTNASKVMRSYPNNFLYSGYFYASSADNRGSYGDYWSSTAYGDNMMYELGLISSNVYPGTYGTGKYFGGSIRCMTDSNKWQPTIQPM